MLFSILNFFCLVQRAKVQNIYMLAVTYTVVNNEISDVTAWIIIKSVMHSTKHINAWIIIKSVMHSTKHINAWIIIESVMHSTKHINAYI